MTPAKLQYVSNIITSKIFWAQIIAVAAAILGIFGVTFLDDPLKQAEIVGIIIPVATIAFRLWSNNGPVTLTGPVVTPPAQNVPAGASVVTVPAPADPVQTSEVQPLDAGTHVVEVVSPLPEAVPATVIVSPP